MAPRVLSSVCWLLVVANSAVAHGPFLQAASRLLWGGVSLFLPQPPVTVFPAPQYDFVVVGGGTAGSVVAARLAMNPRWSVLLLEAGRRDSGGLPDAVPALSPFLRLGDLSWRDTAPVSRQACKGHAWQRCVLHRGRILGGSSVLSSMIHARGNRRDFDAWPRDGEWSYSAALEHFLRSEDVAEAKGLDKRFHASGGPWSVTSPPFRTPLADAFVRAGREIGEHSPLDYNGPVQTGFGFVQASLRNGTRVSAANAYLRSTPRNLQVLTGCHVTKLLPSADGSRVQGVEFLSPDGLRRAALASKEVVLSAGAVGSPQILMLSGIGPREELSRLGIPLLMDSPGVGQNLSDHVGLAGLQFLVNASVSLVSRGFNQDRRNLNEFFMAHSGPLSVPGAEALGFLDHKSPGNTDGYPTFQLQFYGGSLFSAPLARHVYGFSDRVYDAVFRPVEGLQQFTILPVALRPTSRGSVRLRSRNPLEPPVVDPNYLQHDADIQALTAAVRVALELAESREMSRFGPRLSPWSRRVAGCEGLAEDPYWVCVARLLTVPMHHLAGTCAMGSVLDGRLRVVGVAGLRVVDASAFPSLPAANPLAAVLMLAERAADMIKLDSGWPGADLDPAWIR